MPVEVSVDRFRAQLRNWYREWNCGRLCANDTGESTLCNIVYIIFLFTFPSSLNLLLRFNIQISAISYQVYIILLVLL